MLLEEVPINTNISGFFCFIAKGLSIVIGNFRWWLEKTFESIIYPKEVVEVSGNVEVLSCVTHISKVNMNTTANDPAENPFIC